MALIGDGVMAVVKPQHDATAWKKGPKIWRVTMRALAKRPIVTRAIGVAQIAGGIWWALQSESEE
jgi:hypothetical protein